MHNGDGPLSSSSSYATVHQPFLPQHHHLKSTIFHAGVPKSVSQSGLEFPEYHDRQQFFDLDKQYDLKWWEAACYYLARDVRSRFCPSNMGMEVIPNLMHSSYSIAATETQNTNPADLEDSVKLSDLYRLNSKRQSHAFDLHELAADINRGSAIDNMALDLREAVTSLMGKQFINYSVLWPEQNFTLSQIHQWPPAMPEYTTRARTSVQETMRLPCQGSGTTWDFQYSIPSQPSAFRRTMATVSQMGHIYQQTAPRYRGVKSLGVNDEMVTTEEHIQNTFYTNTASGQTAEQYVDSYAFQDCPSTTNDCQLYSQSINVGALNDGVSRSDSVDENDGRRGEMTYDIIQSCGSAPNRLLQDETTDQEKQKSSTNRLKIKKEKISQMVAEISDFGATGRRIPKREEDIKTLQHFRTLKEKGKNGKTALQVTSRQQR